MKPRFKPTRQKIKRLSRVSSTHLDTISMRVATVLLLLLSHRINGQVEIVVGMPVAETTLPTDIGHGKTGGAVGIAMDRLRNEGYMTQYTFKFIVNVTECDEATAAGVAIDLMRDKKVHMLLGPPCFKATLPTAILSTYYKVPLTLWGYNTDSQVTDSRRFPYISAVIPNSLELGYSAMAVLRAFQWTEVGIIYTRDAIDYCASITAMNDEHTYYASVVFKQAFDAGTTATLPDLLARARERARIFFVCIAQAADKRAFFRQVEESGMASNEYLYISLQMRSQMYGQNLIATGTEKLPSGLMPFWVDPTDGKDVVDVSARNGATNSIVIDVSDFVSNQSALTAFQSQVLPRVRQDPLYCSSPSCLTNQNDTRIGSYSRHLHDAVYLMGRATEETLRQGQWSPEKFNENSVMQFSGLTGEVQMNSNATRVPYFFIFHLKKNGSIMRVGNVSYIDGVTTFTKSYAYDSDMWENFGGFRPRSTPLCGFRGDSCPKEFWDLYLAYVIVGCVLVFLLIVFFLVFVFVVFRNRRLEEERMHREWQIPFVMLRKPPAKKEGQSLRSLTSGTTIPSISTRVTIESKINSAFGVYFYNNEPVMSTKHNVCRLDRHNYIEMAKLKKLDNENLNKFVGLSIDGPQYVAVWKYCSRGSLSDIITKGSLTVDSFFIYCIFRDIANGLQYLHSSFVQYHGDFRSSSCLVDDSWQVKISDFGTRHFKSGEKVKKNKLLWCAPEILCAGGGGSKAADVYAFAIICSEVITKKSAWDIEHRKESVEELVYLIKKGGPNPPRPDISNIEVEVNPAMVHLVRDCWSQKEEDRPNMDVVKNLIRSMNPSRQKNLMDHVFNLMEEYAGTLEQEVEERTKELYAEKKKSDVLLYRMLPKDVADKLKIGQSVEPESFTSVTIFFSDVVQFTKLAARCTPLQIVTLLNDLYTMFDTIIEEHGVYKVETIGDGYLCVSGLPHRNGNEHVKDIADMSLDIMKTVKSFKIAHLPGERTNLRIGMHTGPCVSGVVGLTMPRYCLFGDSVNTASRMESNGKPGMIHMSQESNALLVNSIGGYVTESRGEVIIKGKGVMETFWLRGRIGAVDTDGAPVEFTRAATLDIPPTPPMHSEKHLSKAPSEESRVVYVEDTDLRSQSIL